MTSSRLRRITDTRPRAPFSTLAFLIAATARRTRRFVQPRGIFPTPKLPKSSPQPSPSQPTFSPLPPKPRPRALLLRFSALLFLLPLFIAPPAYATIQNGENAIDILGEFNSPSVDTTADYVKGCVNNGASSVGFNLGSAVSNPGSIIDATNHRLFVADNANNRVLVFTLNGSNQIPSKTPPMSSGRRISYPAARPRPHRE